MVKNKRFFMKYLVVTEKSSTFALAIMINAYNDC